MNPEKALHESFCEEPDLECVRCFAVKYYPDYDDQPDMYDYKLTSMEALTNALSEEGTKQQKKEPANYWSRQRFLTVLLQKTTPDGFLLPSGVMLGG